jgi:hypothetical protein
VKNLISFFAYILVVSCFLLGYFAVCFDIGIELIRIWKEKCLPACDQYTTVIIRIKAVPFMGLWSCCLISHKNINMLRNDKMNQDICN